MSIWHKSMKISLAAVISSYLALFIGLVNPLSSGIVAILSVLDTRLDSIRTGIARLLSTLLAFTIATVIFSTFGMDYWVFGIYLLIYVPLAYLSHLDSGIAPCSVLVTHFMLNQSLSLEWQINGLALMFIGVVVAVTFNLFMPSYQDQLEAKLYEIEREFSKLLLHIHDRLLTDSQDMQPLRKQVSLLLKELDAFQTLALIEYDNQVTQKDEYYLEYGRMRMRQGQILSQMIESLENLVYQTSHNQGLADLFRLTAKEFHETNSGVELLGQLANLFKSSRESQLPKSREEFESRAILFHLLHDFENFLNTKNKFYVQWQTKKLAKVN